MVIKKETKTAFFLRCCMYFFLWLIGSTVVGAIIGSGNHLGILFVLAAWAVGGAGFLANLIIVVRRGRRVGPNLKPRDMYQLQVDWRGHTIGSLVYVAILFAFVVLALAGVGLMFMGASVSENEISGPLVAAVMVLIGGALAFVGYYLFRMAIQPPKSNVETGLGSLSVPPNPPIQSGREKRAVDFTR
jgi:hypothetical protein